MSSFAQKGAFITAFNEHRGRRSSPDTKRKPKRGHGNGSVHKNPFRVYSSDELGDARGYRFSTCLGSDPSPKGDLREAACYEGITLVRDAGECISLKRFHSLLILLVCVCL